MRYASRLLLPVTASALFLFIACGDDTGPTGVEPEVLDLGLSTTAAASGARVAVTGIPESIDGLYAEIRTGDKDDVAGVAFIARGAEGDSLVVPLHPDTPLDGGAVELRFTDGETVEAEPLSFEVAPLPPAPGAFGETVDALEELLSAWLEVRQITREELREADPADLSPLDLPLLLAHNVIDRPDNPQSLRAWADGSAPDLPGENVDNDLLDRLVAAAGLDAYIEAMNDFARQEARPTVAAAKMRLAVRNGCIEGPDFGIGPDDGALLAEVMNYQASLELAAGSATEQLARDAETILFTALGFTPAAGYAAGVSAAMWAADVIQQGSRLMYPAEFVHEGTDFTPTVTRFPEDFVEDGEWSDFRVTAVSHGWRFDTVIFQAIMQILGASGGSVDNVLDNLRAREGVGEAIDGTLVAITNYVVTQSTNALIGELTGGSGLILEICPRTWADIDCTDETLSTGRSDDLLVDVAARNYRPQETGTAVLTVETRDVFGPGNHTAEAKEIVTDPIAVHIDPFVANVETGATVDFTVRVENAVNTDVAWRTEATPPESFDSDASSASLVAPEDPWSPPIEVWARSLADTGLRSGQVDGDPREDMAEVRNQSPTVMVEPLSFCVEPGEPQPFSATVIGSETDEVAWSTDPPGLGHFEGDTWYAPETAVDGMLVIATSVADPDAQGFAQGVVGACRCYWTASVTGAAFHNWTGEDAVWSLPYGDGIPFTLFNFDPSVIGSEGPPVISATLEADISGGATGTWPVTALSTVLAADGELPYAAGDPDSDAMPQLTLFTNDGVTTEGLLNGPFFRLAADGETVEVVQVELRFRAAHWESGCDG